MLSFRHVSQSKAVGALASASSYHMVHSQSHFTQTYLEEQEGLFKYTRGRWLYNEREREYLVYALYWHYSLRKTELQRMIFVSRH
jgi:hypothetical protein